MTDRTASPRVAKMFPDHDEIRRRCAEVQAEWDEDERKKRLADPLLGFLRMMSRAHEERVLRTVA